MKGWKARCAAGAVQVVIVLAGHGQARAAAFDDYTLTEVFTMPTGATVFDVLDDGRLITMTGSTVQAETAAGSRTFTAIGTLPAADLPSFGAAFVRVSPDGTRLAVGNNGGVSFGNFEVGVFNVGDLSGAWFGASHFDAEWFDDTTLAITAGAFGQTSSVTALDVTSDPGNATNPTVVTSIGGGTAGITFDGAGNLYTGNGFDGVGPSDTGWIKAFAASDWMPALSGGVAADFEAGGVLVADLLSASSLGFDAEGNLHVGGGDFFGGSGDYGYAGLVRATAVADALAGFGPADPFDPAQVRRFDPDAVNASNFYDLNFNALAQELYVREGPTVYVYAVPEPATWALLSAGTLLVGGRRRRRGDEI